MPRTVSNVTVTNNGSITMTGAGSVGLFAQSVGGGGGVATANNASNFALNAQGNGNGGTVTVTNNGTVSITGDNSAGVFVQSVGGGGIVGASGDLLGLDPGFQGTAGGTGTGGGVSLEQTQNVVVTGLNSFGLLLQSAGGTGNNNISLIVDNGVTVIGGTGTGAGVGFLGGATNLFTNNGAIAAINGLAGSAFFGDTGNNTIDNFGTMIGSMQLGTGTNAIDNEIGGLLIMGSNINLGAANTLTNNGTLSPGGSANVFTSGVTGNLVQSMTGNYFVDVDLTADAGDRINATGSANLAGHVVTNLINTSGAQPGNFQFVIVNAGGGVTNSGLALATVASPLINYALTYPDADDVVLNYSINFSPPGLGGNEASVGNAINQDQLANNSTPLGQLVAALFNVPSLGALANVYDALTGEGTIGTQQTALATANLFGASMFNEFENWFSNETSYGQGNSPGGLVMQYAPESRAQRIAAAFSAFDRDVYQPRWHTWGSGYGGSQTLNGNFTQTSANLSETISGGGGGIDYQPTPDTLWGFAAGASHAGFSVAARDTSGTVDGGLFGLYAASRNGPFYVFGDLAYANFTNRTNRMIATGILPTENASARFGSNLAYGHIEAGYKQVAGALSITPFAAFDIAHLWQQTYAETSTTVLGTPGILGLSYASQQMTSMPGSLGAQLGYKAALPDDMTWSPYVRGAWLYDFAATSRQITPSFEVAPFAPFLINGAAAARNSARLDAGMKLAMSPRAEIFADFTSDFSTAGRSYSGTGGVRLSW